MPKGVKPPNCVGKKGRSGRKSAEYEHAKKLVISKSWNILNDHLEKNDNINVALPIALKDMTDKKELSGILNISFDDTFNTTSKAKGDNSKQG